MDVRVVTELMIKQSLPVGLLVEGAEEDEVLEPGPTEHQAGR